jgi:RNA polymerase sigma factor (sigma-70 family)
VNSFAKPNPAACETELLFEQCRESLVRYLRYHLDDRAEADDIAQESFVRYFQARCREEDIQQPRAWLFRVAHNLLIDQSRKKKAELLDQQGWMSLERRLISPASGVETGVYVSQLPWANLTPAERETLQLRTEGLKFREISEVLGLSISTVVSYVSRAIDKLRATGVEKRATSKHGRTTTAA